ncbi:uncharacterized protein LOC131929583 [Physella acuta]|uniref:uncharacterized protein LOC131929583 n=1 Tax=Physella acuta TaxID=109671 RepID=UPI0027DE401A|nr:uncharacterized protein LOC131929583 [Physella acuta]
MPFKNILNVWKITLFLQVLGLCLTIIGYSTNCIGKFGNEAHIGLWKACDTKNSCYDFQVVLPRVKPDIGSLAWADASRGLLGSSLICLALVILLTITTLVSQGYNKFMAYAFEKRA